MAKASKQITLTETDLPEAARETVRAFVAAKRAATQAEALIKKLSKPVLTLAKAHPGLLVDGARITTGKRKVWCYSAAIGGFLAVLQREQKKERERGEATSRTTEFVTVRELSKFTGQAIFGIVPSAWTRLFGKKS